MGPLLGKSPTSLSSLQFAFMQWPQCTVCDHCHQTTAKSRHHLVLFTGKSKHHERQRVSVVFLNSVPMEVESLVTSPAKSATSSYTIQIVDTPILLIIIIITILQLSCGCNEDVQTVCILLRFPSRTHRHHQL